MLYNSKRDYSKRKILPAVNNPFPQHRLAWARHLGNTLLEKDGFYYPDNLDAAQELLGAVWLRQANYRTFKGKYTTWTNRVMVQALQDFEKSRYRTNEHTEKVDTFFKNNENPLTRPMFRLKNRHDKELIDLLRQDNYRLLRVAIACLSDASRAIGELVLENLTKKEIFITLRSRLHIAKYNTFTARRFPRFLRELDCIIRKLVTTRPITYFENTKKEDKHGKNSSRCRLSQGD